MGLSDLITEFIHQALNASDGVLELQRSELAEYFGCVPSQINYVISTRFSPEHGFIVESRRGGGGYIRIKRINTSKYLLLMHTVNSIGDEIDSVSASAIIGNLENAGAISSKQASLIVAALSGRSMASVPPSLRRKVRAAIIKEMLIVCSDES
ncbi:MAG: CtsR family transcriptional regulator [Eubacteriales bacterium]